MKKIWYLLVALLLMLVSCSRSITVSYEEVKEYQVYAVEEKSQQIKSVYVEYSIIDAEDLFELYTIYQNHLPLGYSSPLSPNTTLLGVKVEEKVIYYIVDNFILVADLTSFQSLIVPTAKLYGYQDVHIIFNENKLF